MKCVYHNNREAEFTCQSCGRPLCRECAISVGGRTVCRECGYNMQYNYQQSPKGDGVNEFLFFIFLLVPGIRHMYIGFMRRGFQFLVTFFGLIAFSTITYGIDGILVPLIMIAWFYSAFDSYHYRKLKASGEKVLDKSIFGENESLGLREFLIRHRVIIGTVIIILGIYMIIRRVLFYNWHLVPAIVADMMDFAAVSILPLLLIVGGVYLIAMAGRKKPADE